MVLVVLWAQAFTLLDPNDFTLPQFRAPIADMESVGRFVDIPSLESRHRSTSEAKILRFVQYMCNGTEVMQWSDQYNCFILNSLYVAEGCVSG